MANSIRYAVVFLVSFLLMAVPGCLVEEEDIDPTVRFYDVYCDNNGHFNFTLVNTYDESLEVVYHWTLDDPRADRPVIEGDGNATLRSNVGTRTTVDLPANFSKDYDHRFYVMCIYVRWEFDGLGLAVDHREQKSPYDWDYSTLPPTRADG